jgi:hypothetical protein
VTAPALTPDELETIITAFGRTATPSSTVPALTVLTAVRLVIGEGLSCAPQSYFDLLLCNH